ncbi:tyrosine-type recombinase/integrase [Roseospira visakhapatnamensis]|uniref:Integrase n=1 Tax=Roseospira visakhapatnamensis TaxID=390880 RepID=A0A7W6RH26_9PROT|nr:tyrosine-type recombinase/integrase [Roseospira visakhapatnamensis]MBB4268197.1 integrase [Roseospira visakhapatnamensis]
MTPVNLPYLNIYERRGKTFAYYRRNGKRVRVTDLTGKPLGPKDAGFTAAYQRIHAGFEVTPAPKGGAGTLAHLIEHYRASPDFAAKAPKTRKDYTRYLDDLKRKYGHLPIRTMPRDFILALRDKHAATPRKANYLIQILRMLFAYAIDRPTTFGVTVNPAARPRVLKTDGGHHPWEEHQVAAFRRHWPVGTWERTAFELALNTGQRGGDVLAMTRGHLVGGAVQVAQSKTGTRLEIPISRDLAEALDPWLTSHPHLAILGKMGVDRFRHRMADAFRAAGLDNVTTHGLRYTAATRLREVGLDWETIGAITGHKTAEMARKYSAQRRAAVIAIDALDRATRNAGGTPSD